MKENANKYDLEKRTEKFAVNCRTFIKNVPKTISNIEDCKQLSKASGSVGANYIEANESLSKKDFIYRVKICRKEVKESRYFLNIMDLQNDSDLTNEQKLLVKEATELMRIFGSIIKKNEN